MSQIDDLKEMVKTQYPTINIEIRKIEDGYGVTLVDLRPYEFLNIDFDGNEIAIECNSKNSFGLSFYPSMSDPLMGLFSSPDFYFASIEEVFEKIKEILKEHYDSRVS